MIRKVPDNVFGDCIGKHDMVLNLDSQVSITLTSSFGCPTASGQVVRHENSPRAFLEAMQFLGKTIRAARALLGGTLHLELEDGTRIELYDDGVEFEPYVIRAGDTTVVI